MSNSYNNHREKEYHESSYLQTQDYSGIPPINGKSSTNQNKPKVEHTWTQMSCQSSKNETLYKSIDVKPYNSTSKHFEQQFIQDSSSHANTRIFDHFMENSFFSATSAPSNGSSLPNSNPKDPSTLKLKQKSKTKKLDALSNAQTPPPINIHSFVNLADFPFTQDSLNQQFFGKKENMTSRSEKTGVTSPISRSGDLISTREDGHSIGSLGKRRLSHEPRTCDKCGRSFKYPSDLKKHEQIHQEVKKFTCNDCGRSFRRMHQLNVHARIHTGEKPYVCSHCGMSFRHDSTLTMHTRTRHEHLRPFKCDICEKMFGRLSHLRKHQRYVCATTRKQAPTDMIGDMPTEFYSYICHRCHSIFINEDTYLQHEAVCMARPGTAFDESTGMQPYIYSPPLESDSYRHCLVCDISFSTSYEYHQHLSEVHTAPYMNLQLLEGRQQNPHDSQYEVYNPASSTIPPHQDITKFTLSSIFSDDNSPFLEDFNVQPTTTSLSFDLTNHFLNTNSNNNESKRSAEHIESLMEDPMYDSKSCFTEDKQSIN